MKINELFEQAETLQNLLVSHATNGNEDHSECPRLRQIFISDPALEPLLPRFVRTCRNLSQFWEFIKHKFKTYRERRVYIWNEFSPILDQLEKGATPSDKSISDVLETFDAAHVHSAWSKALDRRQADPEGAITMARTLLETVCKYILDDNGTAYKQDEYLPKLYRKTADVLNIAPSNHTEQVFKQILGGCTAVVEGLGALRNRISDAHGQGKLSIKPAARHAELAVNLSGSMASFLVATWEKRSEIMT